jgi:hypothetical protein
MKDWDKILEDFAHKCGDGGPDMTNPRHLALLRESLLKFGWKEFATNEFIGNLREGEDKDYKGKGTRTGKPGEYKYDYSEPSSKTDSESEEGGDEDDGEEKTENSTTVTQEQIDEFDGDTKKGGLNKEVKAPGNDASVVNEIGVGYAVACLDSGGDVEKCLIDKFKGTKLAKKLNKETMSQIINSAKAERKRINDHINDPNNPLDSKTTKVAHVWGSKDSLSSAVKKLGEKNVKVVNGVPFDASDENKLYRKKPNGEWDRDPDGNRIPLPVEFDKNGVPKNYAQVILNGGGGEDPTDTTFIMTDDKGNCEIIHSSNKTTSQDIQANGSPYEEINSITESAKNDVPDENGSHAKIDKLESDTKKEIASIRAKQKKYVGSHIDRLGRRVDDDKSLDYILGRLTNGVNGNPRGISTTEGKYFKSILKHKKVKKAMEAKYGKDWAKALQDPNDERYMDDVMKQEIMKSYVSALQSDMEEGVEMRGDDVQIISRLFGKTTVNVVDKKGKVEMKKTKSGDMVPVTKSVHGEEDMIGQSIPDGPDKFNQKELNDFYNQQTQVINNHRLKLNEIGEEQGSFGLGDYHHIQRMIGRLHLNLADGHNPGGIPADRFALNMGVLKRKGDIKKDKDGNFLSKGKDGKYYKYNEDTKRWDDGPFEGKTSELEDNDCAVMADGETHRDCLGLKEGEKLSDGFKVQYDTINASVDSDGNIVDFGGSETASVEAVIYDRHGNIVAVQTCRSKSGPGGSVNDTIQWHPDYQKCMAEHTIVNGKCG